MADNNLPENRSMGPAITVLLVLLILGLGVWDFALQNKNKALQEDVKHLKARVEAVEAHDRAVDTKVAALAPPPSGTSSRRRRAAAAAAAATASTAPTTAPAATAPAGTR